MKRLLVILLICFLPVLAQAQQLNKALIGRVSFQKDSTNWIATVTVKDTVSVLFKMMFEEVPQNALPPTTQYLIIYTPSWVEFSNKRKRQTFTFGIDKNPPLSTNRKIHYWPVIGLSRMNPVCYPQQMEDK